MTEAQGRVAFITGVARGPIVANAGIIRMGPESEDSSRTGTT